MMRGGFFEVTLAACLVASLGSCGFRAAKAPLGSATPVAQRVVEGKESPLLAVLASELEANFARLRGRDQEVAPVYYIGYELVEQRTIQLSGDRGALMTDSKSRDRVVEVDVRVGSREFDNSHTIGAEDGRGLGGVARTSITDESLPLSHKLWLLTDSQYRAALASYAAAEQKKSLRSSAQAEKHPDFSQEPAHLHIEPLTEFDEAEDLAKQGREMVRVLSARLAQNPVSLQSRAVLEAEQITRILVTNEGTRIQTQVPHVHLQLSTWTKAEDGMDLVRSERFDGPTLASLPPLSQLEAAADRLGHELSLLTHAKVAEPYTGPAVLDGQAAAVFFHEIFGHRLEAERQKQDEEGQTFTARLGKRVLPEFLTVVDDPTLATFGSLPLNGHYRVDEEGIPAQRVTLVQAGTLKGFLLGRSPVMPFLHSNGHGRKALGFPAVGRQGNLLIQATRTLSDSELRRALLREVRKRKKAYGLWFRTIEGGYTLTDRGNPQAFKVLPVMVYRVYANGRPDELVRGVDLVGTPLTAFETIVAAGSKPSVFNGVCNAESGWIPVSAISPALLLTNIETERAAQSFEKPPLLPPPPAPISQK